MAICQCMIQDFMYGWHNGYYDSSDLITGIEYARSILEEGYLKEPFHGYDLKEFIEWAKTRKIFKL